MRQAGQITHRSPAATAFVASAAFLAAAAHPAVGQYLSFGQSNDRAMAIPRIAVGPNSAGGVPLPEPLEPSEATRVRRAFELQARGAIQAAERESAQLDMTTLLGAAMVGHILADRYLGRFTRPQADELRAWLDRHADLPDAGDIHALLLVRLPQGVRAPKPPAREELPTAPPVEAASPPPVPEETEPPSISVTRYPALDRDVAETARRRGAAGVTRLLARTDGLSPSYASILQGEAARILFTLGHDEEALVLGAAAARACGRPPAEGCRTHSLGGYVGGLAAWRLGRPETARALFERAWRAPLGTSSLRAASAFWAARAHLAIGDSANHAPWLGRASVEAYTFHGQIARRMLGLASGAAPGERDRGGRETLGEADVEAIAATGPGLRAFALLQVGQRRRAEAEFRLLWPRMRDSAPLARAVMLVAERAGLPELASQLADYVQASDGRPREATRFRIPRLRPDGGYRVDPALVYALARTESNFDTTMVSSAGARGILQIRPETASFITAGNAPGQDGRTARFSRQLHDPAVNLDLGQRYVSYLSGHAAVAGDLIRLLVGYNAGPGNLQKWAATIHDLDDPFLFIEAIPSDETRAFVPRVLSYTWIFADRLHLPTPTLDDLAHGVWPRYRAVGEPAGERLARVIH